MKRSALLMISSALLVAFACAPKADKETPAAAAAPDKAKPGQAPEEFTVKLETTKGDIVIDVTRAWTPHGVDRFYELVTTGYYTDVAFFRVIEGFMAQAGISGNPEVNTKWRAKGVKDDPVKQSNTRGMVSFAKSGRPNSRTTQFFVSFGNNAKLDRMGFAPFGKVRDMAPVDSLYNGYGEGAPRGKGPMQMKLQTQGNAYLKKEFPELDYILKASVI